MAPSIVFGAVLLCTALVAAEDHLNSLSDEFIALINSEQNSWTAGRNFPADTPMANLKMLAGTLMDGISRIPVKEHKPDLIANLPDSFDAREKWPNCPTIKEIDDTGCCATNWIIAAVQTMSDRTCVYSNGTVNVRLSVQDVLSCCLRCGYGCFGGYYGTPWEYWIDEGIVSGGQYGSSEGCMPYDFPPYDWKRGCLYYGYTKTCPTKCEDGYNVTYDKDKHHGKTVYLVSGEDNIRAEMFTNGPVEVLFLVYGDFLNYKHGVYSHKRGDWHGVQTVKMLGWGVEKGKKYWLVANNWGNLWGDKGYFKILRGKDECLIESYALGGEPA